MRNRYLKRIIIAIVLFPAVVLSALIAILYWKQDAVVQELIVTANADFKGLVRVKGSHISPFSNFPYISIDLDGVEVYEDKAESGKPVLRISDIYLGFDILDLLTGKTEIKAIRLSEGEVSLVQYSNGSMNLANALEPIKPVDDAAEEFHLDIRSIRLENIDVVKLNQQDSLLVEAFIRDSRARFRTGPAEVVVSVDSRFELNVIQGKDSTFIRRKDFEVESTLRFDPITQILTIQPSELKLENAFFKMDGSVDFDDDMNVNIRFHGNKPDFNLFLAFAPPELEPVLSRYDNAGKIFFEASVKGKSANGHLPVVTADFGCEDAFFSNRLSNKKLDKLFFRGHFTTGEKGNLSTAEFSLADFSARPEAGTFSGKLMVRNFESPEIDMQLVSDFQLDFLAKFLNIENLQDLRGSISLTMNFHDIIDLNNPEKSIEKLNESYFTKLEVKDLSFRTSSFHLPIHDIDINATMEGHEAKIDHFNLKVGDSDIFIKASVSDLPAILHHTHDPVTAVMDIKSSLLDIRQLTSGDTTRSKPFDERITDFRMKLKFNSSAKAFTESPNLPVGEFFIDDLFAKLSHYPHTLHDFHADVFVDAEDFRVIDFTGMIDRSDFHFNGRLRNYDLWFMDSPLGDTRMEFTLDSKLLQMEDVFSYGGQNYVPQDYHHEEFRNLIIHGFADLHFNKGLRSADLNFDRLEATMKVHPMRFEKFRGRVHFEDEHLVVRDFSGKLGKSEFTASLDYYLGPDSVIRKRDNRFSIKATRLDFDELFSYNPPPANKVMTPADHEAGFNIYTVPFSDMRFEFDIKKLNYHRYLIDEFFVQARTTRNHFIYVDTASLGAAGGKVWLKGYFNGSDPAKIYFSPDMKVKDVDLDKLLFKFENFGQDHLVSENLHGKLSGTVTGKVRMHKDMVPIIDESEIHLDVKVVNGRLEHYSALDAMSDFFSDKNLKNVRFDTLHNKFDMVNGVLSIPSMTIASTLGFIELSGKQDMNMNMEYYVRVPLKLVTQVASQKLFGGKKPDDPTIEDEIQYRDEDKRYRFVNIKIAGTPEEYNISLQKEKRKK